MDGWTIERLSRPCNRSIDSSVDGKSVLENFHSPRSDHRSLLCRWYICDDPHLSIRRNVEAEGTMMNPSIHGKHSRGKEKRKRKKEREKGRKKKKKEERGRKRGGDWFSPIHSFIHPFLLTSLFFLFHSILHSFFHLFIHSFFHSFPFPSSRLTHQEGSLLLSLLRLVEFQFPLLEDLNSRRDLQESEDFMDFHPLVMITDFL